MHVDPVDERDSSWESFEPRFRVYIFSGGDDPARSWATATDDVTGADFDEVHQWARDRAGSDDLYAITLVRDEHFSGDQRRRRGLVWLLGVDANIGDPTPDEKRRLDAMHRRRAAYQPSGESDPAPRAQSPLA